MKERSWLLLACSILILLAACDRREKAYLSELQGLERGEYRDQALSQDRVDQLLTEIKRYEKEVEKKVDASGQIGVFYKMLAVQYMRAGMYQEAEGALEQARTIYPENPVLFYLTGVTAARVAKAQLKAEEQLQWFERAVLAYQRAIDLDPLYVDALYGLSVLYVFELQQPEAAEDLLKRVLSKEKKNVDALFLLGNVYYQTGRPESAIEVYDIIAEITSVDASRQEALDNKKKIEDELYGRQ